MTKAGLIVKKSGPLSLIEDMGRNGFFRQGMTVGGAADQLSFRWANRLCGNRANTTAVEIVIGGAEFETTEFCQVALAGGDADIRINTQRQSNWCSHNLSPGDTLKIGPIKRGTRVYLAVRDGLQISRTFHSTATITRERIGGLSGEALKNGDFLPFTPCRDEQNFYLPQGNIPHIFETSTLHMVVGWQYASFSKALKHALFKQQFVVSNASNRMGIRLAGEALDDHDSVPRQMVSEGIVAGAVQIPPNGLPIIMLNDHQTIGGYPKAGTILSSDLWKLAQLPPGSPVCFKPVSVIKAQNLRRRVLKEFESTLPARA